MATEQQLQAKFTSIVASQKSRRLEKINTRYPDRFIREGTTVENGYTYEVNEFKKPDGDIGITAYFRNDGETQRYVIEYLLSTDSTNIIGWVQDLTDEV